MGSCGTKRRAAWPRSTRGQLPRAPIRLAPKSAYSHRIVQRVELRLRLVFTMVLASVSSQERLFAPCGIRNGDMRAALGVRFRLLPRAARAARRKELGITMQLPRAARRKEAQGGIARPSVHAYSTHARTHQLLIPHARTSCTSCTSWSFRAAGAGGRGQRTGWHWAPWGGGSRGGGGRGRAGGGGGERGRKGGGGAAGGAGPDGRRSGWWRSGWWWRS